MAKVKKKYDVCLCENCIEAIQSRGEPVFKGPEVGSYESETYFDDNAPTVCEWCEEEDTLYECIW